MLKSGDILEDIGRLVSKGTSTESSQSARIERINELLEAASRKTGPALMRKRIKETESNIEGIRNELTSLSSLAKEIELLKNTQRGSINNQVGIIEKLEVLENGLTEQKRAVESIRSSGNASNPEGTKKQIKGMEKTIDLLKAAQGTNTNNQIDLIETLKVLGEETKGQNKKLGMLRNELSEQKKAVESLHASLETIPKQEGLNKRIKETESNIEGIRNELTSLSSLAKEVESLKTAQGGSISNQMILVKKLERLDNDILEQAKSIHALEAAPKQEGMIKRIKEMESNIESMAGRISEISSLASGAEQAKALAKEIESIKSTQSKSIDNQVSLIEKLEEFEKELSEHKEMFEGIISELSEQKKAVESLHASEKDMESLRNISSQGINNQMNLTEKLNGLKNDILEQAKSIHALEAAPKQEGMIKRIKEMESNIEGIRIEMDRLAPLVKDIESAKSIMKEVEAIKNAQNESIKNQASIVKMLEGFKIEASKQNKKLWGVENKITEHNEMLEGLKSGLAEQKRAVESIRSSGNASNPEGTKKQIKGMEKAIDLLKAAQGANAENQTDFIETLKVLGEETKGQNKKLGMLRNELAEQKKAVESLHASLETIPKQEGLNKRIEETESNIEGIRNELTSLSSLAKEVESLKTAQGGSISNQMILVKKLERLDNDILEQAKSIHALEAAPLPMPKIDLRKTPVPEQAIDGEESAELFNAPEEITDEEEANFIVTKSNGRIDGIVDRLERVKAKINS